MENIGGIIFLCGMITLLFLYFWFGKWTVRNWAEKNSFRIVKIENKGSGPFTPWQGTKVYYVTIRDTEGRLKKAWIHYQGLIPPLPPKIEWD